MGTSSQSERTVAREPSDATFEWRGLGEVPWSALKIRAAFADFDAEALLAAAAILDDRKEHAAMAAAARSLARPGAADAVAELVLAAAQGRPLPDSGHIDAVSRGVAG